MVSLERLRLWALLAIFINQNNKFIPMKLFKDTDYAAAASTLTAPPIEVNQIKAASLNLKVGKIYVPGTKKDDLGGVSSPRTVFSLEQGATAVLKTSQEVSLSARQVGIMFPPNHVSLKGLLMTNPGHVDPGYKGHLHVTVINMGSEPYELRLDDQIVRLMIFELDGDVEKPYGVGSDPITEQLLSKLSFDFFDISARIKSEVERQERKTKLLQVGVPVFVALLGVAGTFLLGYNQFGERLAKLEALSSVGGINKMVDQTKADLQRVSQRLDNVEKQTAPYSKGRK
ncbi:hypothetical protein [Noviherbaspirillum sp.]|uniref:dCTP deaminase domain-containing protein n=1 Tax=Noviherbaspirillum sp. TaxID=1926288 RepID=UPI0025D72667|nr:hypothetical protein [Noviherbaspirillum sp.]